MRPLLPLINNAVGSVVAVAKFMQKPRGKIELSKTKTIAMGLHRQMYTAFAE